MDWDADANSFLDAVCAELPFFIRGQARSATREKAEQDARAAGRKVVSREAVVQAMIAITPPPMKGQLKALLEKQGVDTSQYDKQLRG